MTVNNDVINECAHFSTTLFNNGKAECFHCDAIINEKREVIGKQSKGLQQIFDLGNNVPEKESGAALTYTSSPLFTYKSLRETAIKVFGCKPESVRENALSLYEKGLITYPLTDETTPFANTKSHVFEVLKNCSASPLPELNFLSDTVLNDFENLSQKFFVNDPQSELLGAPSGIMVCGIADRDNLSNDEYALYVLILTQVKACLMNLCSIALALKVAKQTDTDL